MHKLRRRQKDTQHLYQMRRRSWRCTGDTWTADPSSDASLDHACPGRACVSCDARGLTLWKKSLGTEGIGTASGLHCTHAHTHTHTHTHYLITTPICLLHHHYHHLRFNGWFSRWIHIMTGPILLWLDRFFWASRFFCIQFLHYSFCLVPCCRLRWLLPYFPDYKPRLFFKNFRVAAYIPVRLMCGRFQKTTYYTLHATACLDQHLITISSPAVLHNHWLIHWLTVQPCSHLSPARRLSLSVCVCVDAAVYCTHRQSVGKRPPDVLC